MCAVETSCRCGGKGTSAARPGARSLPMSRVQAADAVAQRLLGAKLGKGKRRLQDGRVQVFERGFGVGAWAATDTQLVMSAAGAVDRVPVHATVSFDLSFFFGSKKNDDILWVELQVASPGRRTIKAPLRGVGVLRDPESGQVLRVDDFELAADLMADIDIGEIAKAIACILACVGLFCALLCGPACVTVVACIACLAACVGADLEAFLLCVEACHIATS